MPIEKQPFIRYKTGEPDPLAEGKVITVRLNAAEYKALVELMNELNLTTESSALKVAAMAGANVLHTVLGAEFLKWLSNRNRLSREAG